jgi:hypothetical protein
MEILSKIPALVFHGIIVASQSVHRQEYYWAFINY